MNKKMYVDVNEICEDWGVSRAQGYKMIKQLNERMLSLNPNLIVLSGKVNRSFYEENCYGMAKEGQQEYFGRRYRLCQQVKITKEVLGKSISDIRIGGHLQQIEKSEELDLEVLESLRMVLEMLGGLGREDEVNE